MNEYLFPTPGSDLKKLLDCYAQSGCKFTQSMAAIDLMIDLDKEVNGMRKPTYRAYADRWKWSKSDVGRSMENLTGIVKEMRNFYKDHTWDKLGQGWDKTQPKQPQKGASWDSVGQGWDKDTIYIARDQITDISLKEKKNTTYSKKRKDSTPFTIRQAEVYFQSRLDKDPAAVRAGFQADFLAQDFWGHWDGKDFTDADGKIISETTWRRRAATWYRLKDKYRNGNSKPKPMSVRTYDGTSDPEFAHFYQ